MSCMASSLCLAINGDLVYRQTKYVMQKASLVHYILSLAIKMANPVYSIVLNGLELRYFISERTFAA